MLKRLQENARTDGGVVYTPRPTELIIDNRYTAAAIRLIDSARSEIRLCAYAWRWYANEPEIGIQKLNMALIRAQKRGVIVRCLVDTEAIKDTLKNHGFNVRAVDSRRMLHTKAIGIDYDALLIGSHNLTKRANTDNYEASILSYEYEVVAQFVDYFDRMWDSRG